MIGLKRRIAALEGTEPEGFDPAIRRWLGMELTAAEQAVLDARAPVSQMTAEDCAVLDKIWHAS